MKNLCVIISIILLASCNNIENKILKMQSSPIKLCLNQMSCLMPSNNRDSITYCKNINEASYKLIVYVDSLECMSCMSGKMHDWDNFIQEINNTRKDVKILFLFSPMKKEINNLTTSLILQNLNFPVFIDAKNIFASTNKNIPKESIMHTFLIDKGNNVKLVGDPRRNKQIHDLFNHIIEQRL